MTVISPVAEAARESARTASGKFGAQAHTSPELTLDDYAYPPLIRGLTPAEIDINFWDEDGTWQVQVTRAGTGNDFDDEPGEQLIPTFTIPLTGQMAQQFRNADYWWTLDEAPIWLRDAVTPALAEENLHPDAAAQMARWRKDRHERLLADGGFASSYDNEYLLEFEDEYSSNTAQDAADALGNLPRHEEDGRIYDEDERETAAAELSRRAAAGVGGALTDLRELKAGDRIALSHLVHSDDRENGTYDDLVAVARPDTTGADGDVYIGLEGGGLLCLPIGARVPTLGYDYQGTARTPSQVVQQLVSAGDLPPEARRLNPHDAIATYNASRTSNHPDFIRQVTPTA